MFITDIVILTFFFFYLWGYLFVPLRQGATGDNVICFQTLTVSLCLGVGNYPLS